MRVWIDPIFEPLKGYRQSQFFGDVIDQKRTYQ